MRKGNEHLIARADVDTHIHWGSIPPLSTSAANRRLFLEFQLDVQHLSHRK